MPDHVHLLIRKHRDTAETMIAALQEASRAQMCERKNVPVDHPVWIDGGWKVFLDSPDDIWRTIRYIERNPIRDGLPSQRWDFVSRYDGWPLHRRH